jgi:hypothetical protein
VAGPAPGSILSTYNAQAAPVLQQAQTFAQAPQPLPPGLDPTSLAAQRAVQGNQSIQGLAQLGYDTLAGTNLANQGLFQGMAAMGAKYLPLAQAQGQQNLGTLRGQRAASVVSNLGTLRSNQQNADLAAATLGLNTTKESDTVTTANKNRRARIKTAKIQANTQANRPITSGPFAGYTNSQVAKMPQAKKDKITSSYNATHGPGAAAVKAKQKQQQAITKATGGIQNRITDVQGALSQTGLTKTVSVPNKKAPRNLLTGQYPTVKKQVPLTPADLRQRAVNKYGAELVGIAEAVRNGTPLTKAQIAYLHRLDPNIRIPKSWLRPTVNPYAPGAQTNVH